MVVLIQASNRGVRARVFLTPRRRQTCTESQEHPNPNIILSLHL